MNWNHRPLPYHDPAIYWLLVAWANLNMGLFCREIWQLRFKYYRLLLDTALYRAKLYLNWGIVL